MPVAPYFPTVVITIRALEVYRVTHLRCPRLGIQPFVRALCDIHGVAPRPWLASQFSVAYDLYLAIRAAIDQRVQRALGRDTPNWRLKNACPACMYKVEDEPTLIFPFLSTIDGGNSLSRYEQREREEVDEDGTTAPGASKARRDERVTPGDYYISREEVDTWSKEGLDDLMKSFVPDTEDEENDDGCTERWQNMKEDVTGRAWGCLTKQDFSLRSVDTALAKYGYAVVAHLLKVLGELGVGYDIGCKFAKMVAMHPALSKLAADNHFKSLVGAWHGHAHNRRCQLTNLTTYVEGVGLEDLEGCESFFSKSNALAATTRYATRFHRQQAITTYLKHTDTFDTYQSLSLVICNKYRRALKIKGTERALRATMRQLGVASRDEFEVWLGKEKAHLRTLSKEPLQETLEMEYYQKLVNLRELDERVNSVFGLAQPFVPAEIHAGYADAAKATRRMETQRRHVLELHSKTVSAVQDLEMRLNVGLRWVFGDENWTAAAALVGKRRYQRALDHLEGLIIARMFELAKCNMSGTGYKLRKHIAKSLQARSKAVKNALTRYNEAAESMSPPKPTLDWEEVVEYAFLSDFDLLREGREDIRGEPWALPSGRAAMDQHFKLLRADEEIKRLNVEIRRFVTYMGDEDAFLAREEALLREEGNEGIAHQVGLVRTQRGRFTALHMSRLVKLSKVAGFKGDIVPGQSICRERHLPVMRAASPLHANAETLPPVHDGSEDDDEDDDNDDDDDSGLTAAFMNILRISRDDGGGDIEDT
ncbi:hypothetical protein DFH06DRAFT_1268637 [Mycena polygramma]|nr:hypothetical protein DFH06DRAFT_1268637 [Mycena polygramma]